MRKIGCFVLLGAVVAATAALAGNTTVVTPRTGDVTFPITPPKLDRSGGSIGDATRGGMAPVNGVDAYFKVVPASGFNYTFGPHQREMLFRPTGTISAGYVTLAAAPIDGAQQCSFTTQTITNFYVSANVGQSINNAVTSLAANAKACYTYSLSNKTWDRSQ